MCLSDYCAIGISCACIFEVIFVSIIVEGVTTVDHLNLKNIAVIGVGGAIGRAVAEFYAEQSGVEKIITFSRSRQDFADKRIVNHTLNYYDETQLAQAASRLEHFGGMDAIFVTTGVLHNDDVVPEKSLKELTMHNFETIFKIDAIVPALLVKHFSPMLHKKRPSIMVVLTARVGSISDNRFGGWYAYRCAKSALNMFVKNASIELKRRYNHQMIIAMHPGTVDSPLSEPYKANLDPNKVFTPAVSASHLAKVVSGMTPEDTGKIIAWDGQIIDP